jgi:signal recognition particle subunit SEC65
LIFPLEFQQAECQFRRLANAEIKRLRRLNLETARKRLLLKTVVNQKVDTPYAALRLWRPNRLRQALHAFERAWPDSPDVDRQRHCGRLRPERLALAEISHTQ